MLMAVIERLFHVWKGGDDVRELPKFVQRDIVEHGVHSSAPFHARDAVHGDSEDVTTR